jgi:hypothetical protein
VAMKSNAKMSRPLAASLLAAAVLSGAAAPATGQAQWLSKPIPDAAAMEFKRHLPPVAPVPWLDARLGLARAALGLPQAGSLEALLMQPTPATRWPSHLRTEAASLRTEAR